MLARKVIEILNENPDKEVVLDNCDGTVSPLLQIANLSTDDNPKKQYFSMDFDENKI